METLSKRGLKQDQLDDFDQFLDRQRRRLHFRFADAERRLRERLADLQTPEIEVRKQPGAMFCISIGKEARRAE
jgi:hypothetical protein